VLYNQQLLLNRLSPIIKWPGGKELELKYIHQFIPTKFDHYYEPFVGGGAVFFSITANKKFINDKSKELIRLYTAIKEKDELFFNTVEEMVYHWNVIEKIVHDNSDEFIDYYKRFSNGDINELDIKDWIQEFVQKYSKKFNEMLTSSFNFNNDNFIKEINRNLINKIKRMKKIEAKKGLLPTQDIVDNIKSALKSAFYMHFRHLYNNIGKYNIGNSKAASLFFFIRNFAYSSMFRYNRNGEFNVPYGGIGYNRKNLQKKIDYFKSKALIEHFKNTVLESLDFEHFFTVHSPNKNDFIFLDPPYDSDFSTYAKNEFSKDDQTRLANYLINTCQAKWLLVIKNTTFIFDLYRKPKIEIHSFDKKYLVSFQNRNDKNAQHLVIRNYK